MAGEQLFYIYYLESGFWMGPNGGGSHEDFHVAGKYTIDQALQICAQANAPFDNGYDILPLVALVPVVESKQE